MNRELLFRSVFRGTNGSPSGDCISPISSLTQSLHASSLTHTPCKRLSLSSSISDSSDINHDISIHSVSEENSFTKGEFTQAAIRSPHINKSFTLDKENIPATYYSPTHKKSAQAPSTPLQDVQNITKNLTFSPFKKMLSPSIKEFASPIKEASTPEACDSNSRDSGYSESSQKADGFIAPSIEGPTRKLNLDMSPPKFNFSCERRKFPSFSSLKRSGDEDAFLMEMLSEMDPHKNEPEAPSSTLSSLLSAPIQCNPADLAPRLSPMESRQPIRRCLSMVDNMTPVSSRVQSIYLNTKMCSNKSSASPPKSNFTFKRPQPPLEASSPINTKRRKLDTSPKVLSPKNIFSCEKSPFVHRQMSAPETVEQPKSKFHRSHSESHLSIMRALNKSSCHNELTGDFSRPMVLPLITGGKHPDLKCINIHTMASLIKGEYKEKVNSFSILDCRYPYEYEGGHIASAINWHTPQMACDFLQEQTNPPKILDEKSPRRIYIFHCEFSAERAPKIQRILRETDRQNNKEHYPALHFPEIYLLEGGYKAFYETYPELCSPSKYVKMLDENHTEDLKHFRAKSKSWASETKQGVTRGARIIVARTGRKKLGI